MTDVSQRLKVLISAYACEPERGSEPGVGWNWALQASREHEVWVLTWSKFRQRIEAEQARVELPNLHFAYYELPRWARLLARSERLHYLLWQAGVLPLARRLQREVRFDVVHHLTFSTIEAPGFLWSLGSPFVWGPVGGGQVPAAALRAYFRSWWPVEMLRGLRKEMLGLNPFARIAARRAACVLAGNPDTALRLEHLGARQLQSESEIAVQLPPEPVRDMTERPFTIAWAGLLVPRKGPLLALDVAATLKARGLAFRLVMAGEGPWRELIARRIAALSLESEVELAGALSYEQMPGFYRAGDVFLFTSLQDTNGTVVLEAMAHGLPVVSLDQHGAAAMVTPECGVKVPVQSQQQVIDGLATALQTLAADPERRRLLGAAARARIAERYTWAHKASLLAELYARVARGTPTPTTASSPAFATSRSQPPA